MKLRKNLGAKLVAVLASVTVLGGVWALVRQNPPASAETAASEAAASTPQVSRTPGSAIRNRTSPTPQPAQGQAQPALKRHTRTRAS